MKLKKYREIKEKIQFKKTKIVKIKLKRLIKYKIKE